MATVLLTKTAQGEFDDLPKAMKPRVLAVFVRLQAWPVVAGAKPLRYDLAGSFRIRVRDFRVVFHVTGTTVIVDSIANRKDVYDE